MLPKSRLKPGSEITIPGSKSETNRLLLLQALYRQISIANASDSDDSEAMTLALAASNTIDVGHAGTAMRFLTAYFAQRPGHEVIITGSSRLQQRPIGVLVDALRQLGASVCYLGNDGCPPLRISGKALHGGRISVAANISSQFISALMMIAPKMPDGLEIELIGQATSEPYLLMTLRLLRQIGIDATYQGGIITIPHTPDVAPIEITVESDWSSASYFYALVALSEPGAELVLRSFRRDSLQGDAELPALFRHFGVSSDFEGDTLRLVKDGSAAPTIHLDLNRTPDLAQTIAVVCLGLGVSGTLSGLHTLKIKETDRIEALRAEMKKWGADVDATSDSLTFTMQHPLAGNVTVDTYDDHRMAMAFAPLMLKAPLEIRNPEVVSKSFPGFWQALMEATAPA